MTEEEMAKEYAEHNQGKYTNEFGNLYHAFLAGLKTGKDMAETDLATVAYMQGAERYKPKWHDLRKDKNDLPEKGENKFESKVVYISYSDGDTDFAYYEFPHKEWYRLFNDEPTIPPIAWCEIPKYTEE